MVPYTKYLLALLVILEASQALPVSQKDEKNVEEEIVVPIDEAKEFKYELNRDQYLQGGINGGQSGWALELISNGAKPEEVISGSVVRRKRQSEAASMPDHLQAPDAKAEEEPAVTEEPAPIVNEAYAKRLGGFAQKAALLAGAKRTKIERGPGGYGRKKRMSVDQDEIEIILEPETDPINHAYAQMFAGSSNPEEILLMAENFKKEKRSKRQSLSFEEEIFPVVDETNEIEQPTVLVLTPKIKSWGEIGLVRPKRQSISFEEEAIMQEIFPVVDEINEIEQPTVLVLKPKIKSWGETGLVRQQV
jgi:hypothetical protein